MRVSIIIPYKNANNYLELAYENLSRFKDPYELVFVNNLTDDGSDIELKKMFPEATFLENNIPFSPGISRNIGIEYVTSDKIIFCDIDDILIKSEIDKLINITKDIVIGQTYRTFYDEERNVIKEVVWKKNVMKKGDKITPEMYIDTILHGKIFDTVFLKKSGVKFPSGIYEDKYFLFYLYKLNPDVEILEIPLYHWNVFYKSNSATNQRNITEIENRISVVRELANNSEGAIKKVIVNNFFNHDFVVYLKDFNTYDDKTKKILYNFYTEMKKKKPQYNKLTKRSKLIYVTSLNYFTFCVVCNKLADMLKNK